MAGVMCIKMTEIKQIKKFRKLLKYAFVAFLVNAIASIANPWWPQIYGIDFHFIIGVGIVLFAIYSVSAHANIICSSCSKRIFPAWAQITGAMFFQNPTTCPHCSATLVGNA